MSLGRAMETVEELLAREDEVAREWEWLQEAINLVARAKSVREYLEARGEANTAEPRPTHRLAVVS